MDISDSSLRKANRDEQFLQTILGEGRRKASIFYVVLCSCLTHLSEKCVKMKPKYRLPAQTLAASVTGM